MKINLPLHYQLRIYFSKTELREGICSGSAIEPDKHMLLWDFDNSKLEDILNSLDKTQNEYLLSNIYVIQSSTFSYHAYCFTAQTFRETIHILSSVKQIDDTYLCLGMVRGYYTLRITPRFDSEFKFVCVLGSSIEPNINPLDLTNNEYWTTNIKTGVYKNEVS